MTGRQTINGPSFVLGLATTGLSALAASETVGEPLLGAGAALVVFAAASRSDRLRAVAAGWRRDR